MTLFELVGVLQIFLFGCASDQQDVRHVADEVLAHDIGRHLLELVAEVLHRDEQVALPDVDSIDAREDRVRAGPRRRGRRRLLRAPGQRRQHQEPEGDPCRSPAAPRRRCMHRGLGDFRRAHGGVLVCEAPPTAEFGGTVAQSDPLCNGRFADGI
jgi:hypothetical protein